MPAIMEVVLESTYRGQQCITRFNYQATGTPAAVSYSFALTFALGAQEAGAAFAIGSVMELIQDLASTGLEFVQMTARDVHSVTDFYNVPFLSAKVGQDGGTGMSPTAALGFRTNRTRLDIRRGQRRLPGVTEGIWTTGGILEGAAETTAATLATRMSANLEYDDEGNTLTFLPIVCQKEQYTVPGSSPERFAYRYYDTYAEQLDHSMTGITWEVVTSMRTQTSRQYGKGR